MHVPQVCYMCGSNINLTRDHIPPDGFFPNPKPQDLITVSCCNNCNNSFKLDDEAFRVFAASNVNRSNAGDWIWKNKVINSTFKRSPKFKQRIIESIIPLKDVQTGSKKWGLAFPIERGEKFLTRITKGLIRHYFPSVDYSNGSFKVTHINPSQQIIDDVLSKFPNYDERGNGVFRVWFAPIDSTKLASSLWIYVFYDALMFMVEVDMV